MTGRSVFFVTGLSLILGVCYAQRPLWHTDLWDHINYGHHILGSAALPDTEPLLPLAAGTPMTNTAWGAQVLLAVVTRTQWLGLPALQFLHGLLVVLALAALGLAIDRNSRSMVWAVLGYGICLAINWQQWLIIRPQTCGTVLFSVVLLIFWTRLHNRRIMIVLVPLIFATWASLHGSWAMGLAFIGTTIAGRFLDSAWRTGSVIIAAQSQTLRHMTLLLLLGTAAVLINPYGVDVYRAVLDVGKHPNIASMYEWNPLSLQMQQGQIAATVAIAVLFVLTVTPKRPRMAELLPLVGAAVLTIWSSRMINWFAPVAAFVLATHAAAVSQAVTGWPRSKLTTTGHRRSLWCTLNVVIVVVTFATSTWGRQTLRGERFEPTELVSSRTPVRLGQYLARPETAEEDLVFVPAEWSGYLVHATAGLLHPMVNLHVHVIPPDVWSDYLLLNQGAQNWPLVLQRYNMTTVVANKRTQGPLIMQLVNSHRFQINYQDQQAIVLSRIDATPAVDGPLCRTNRSQGTADQSITTNSLQLNRDRHR